MAKGKGCLLVGSVCLPNAETVFRKCVKGMPERLKRIPDGETGERHYFTFFQKSFFKAVPEMLVHFVNNETSAAIDYSPKQIQDSMEKLRQSDPSTGYDTAAIESYQVFKSLKAEDVIPKGTRFQVCLPGIANVVSALVQRDFQATVAPVYEAALFKVIRNLQDNIDHEDLSIQIDLAAETGLWENLPMFRPWFFHGDKDLDNRKQYIVDYIARIISQIDSDVELGIHNCYGDMEHRHYMEPESLKVITERGLAIFKKSSHPINFFHVPVPQSAMGHLEAYYEPLKQLLPMFERDHTELFLGVVRENDPAGSQKRVDVAAQVLEGIEFGVATECGWGRIPSDDIQSIMEISMDVSTPIM